MAALRAICIFALLLAFFLLGAPLQWFITRQAFAFGHAIPAAFCRSLLWLLRVRVSRVGSVVASGPVLLAANHVSWIDILVLGAIRPFCFLAKSEVARWPLVSVFAEVQGTVFVDRKRRRSIPGANRMMAARMAQGRPVLLFPEGTTSDAAEPGPFRTSHFAAARDLLRSHLACDEVAVQPVAIRYSSPGAAWVRDDDLLSHLWRTLRAPPVACQITFAAAIPYRISTDRKHVGRLARESVIEALGRKPVLAEAATTTPISDPLPFAAKHC